MGSPFCFWAFSLVLVLLMGLVTPIPIQVHMPGSRGTDPIQNSRQAQLDVSASSSSTSGANQSASPISTPIIGKDGPPHLPASTAQNHWWLIDYWDSSSSSANLPAQMTAEFTAMKNSISGLDCLSCIPYQDAILYLPINVAYGTSPSNCVWFQFDIQFSPNGQVYWYIWDILCPGNVVDYYPNGDYHYTPIGVPYVAGDNYNSSIIASGSNTITFSISDQTSGQSWSINSWVWTVPSTTLLATDSTFSPASAVEGYTTNSGLTNVPTLQTQVGDGIPTDRNVTAVSGSGVPSGISTWRFSLQDSVHWIWEMLSNVECGGTGNLSADQLICSGIGPTSIGITWGQSGYPFFGRYELRESISGPTGPWTTVVIVSAKSNTTQYLRDLLPGTTYWWEETDYSCCGFSATSNIIQVTQPATPTLSTAWNNQNSIRLSWNNNAIYGRSIAFNSYSLFESLNQSSYTELANLSSEPLTGFTVNAPSLSTDYSFFLESTDTCATCPDLKPTTSNSNTVSHNGAPAFIGGLFGEYWNASFYGAALSGCATFSSPVTPSIPPGKTTTDSQVNFGISIGWSWHPVGSGNEFSTRWIGGIMIPTNGTYSFQLVSDDGSWLYIDSALVLNHGGQHAITDAPGITSLFLIRGVHQIEVDYYETCGPPSGITLSWIPPGAAGFVLVPSNALVAPPRLDGQGAYTSCGSQAACQLLSTSNGGDLIAVVADCEIQSQAPTCTSITPLISDGQGLGFSLRGSYCFSGTSFGSCIWEYYAVANSPLNNDNITGLSGLPPGSTRWGIMTLAVSGANANAIFDPALPAGQNCSALNGASADCGIGIATSTASAPAPYELLLTMTAQNDAGPCYPPVAQGWYASTYSSGNQELHYQIVPLGTSNHSFTCTGSADPLIIFADGIQAPAPDFTIAGNPSVVTVDAGMIGNTTFSLTSLDGFAATIGVGINSTPAGLTCSLSTLSIVLSSVSSSTLSCFGIAGFYGLTLTGTGGGKSHSVRIAFDVTDFTLNGTPNSLNIPAGSNATSTLTLASLGGFSDNVNVATTLEYHSFGGGGVAGHTFAMAAMTCNLNMTLSTAGVFVPQNATGQAVITVSALSCTAPGIYEVTISASRNELVRTITLTVTLPVPGANSPTGAASVLQTTYFGHDATLSSLGMIFIGGLALLGCVLASPGESASARHQRRLRPVQRSVLLTNESGAMPSVILQSRRLG